MRPEGVTDGQQVDIPAPAIPQPMTLLDFSDRLLVVLICALRGKVLEIDRGREKFGLKGMVDRTANRHR